MSLYLIGGMFCLPFVIAYHDVPIPNFYNEWIAGLLGLLALWPLITKPFWQSPTLPRSSFIFLVLLLLTYLQAMLTGATAPHLPLIQGYLIWGFLLTTLGYQLRQQHGWEAVSIVLAWSLLIGSAINGLFVVMQLLQHSGIVLPIPRLESYGMLAQRNHFANFISLGIVSLMYLHAKRAIQNRWTVISLAMALVMLSFSGSRSAMLYLGAIALLCGLLHLTLQYQKRSIQTTERLLKISLMLLPSFLMLQLAMNAWLPETFIQTPLTRAMDGISNPSASLRLQFWQTSLALFSQSPLLGMGVGQMRWQTYLLAATPSINPSHMFFEHAHNLFLNLMAEMGLLGLLTALGGLLLWARAFFRHHVTTVETWWLLGCLGIIFIHSMVEYPLWYSYFLGIFAFLLGMGEASTVTLANFSQSARKLLRLSLAGVLVYGLWQLAFMQIGYQKLEKQILFASQPEMSLAQKQDFVNEMLWVNQNTLLAPYAELVLATYLAPNPTQAELQRSIAENAIRFIPLRRPCLHFILLLELLEKHDQASAHLRRLLSVTNGNLEQDIQQLPNQEARILREMVIQQKSADATATAP